MEHTIGITLSHNKFKTVQGRSCLFEIVRAQSILLSLQREFGC